MTIMHIDRIISEKSGKRKDGTPYTRKLFEGTHGEGETGVFSTFYNITTGETYEGKLIQGKDKQGKPYSTLTFEVESVFSEEPKAKAEPTTDDEGIDYDSHLKMSPPTNYTLIPDTKPDYNKLAETIIDGLAPIIHGWVAWDCSTRYYNTFTNKVTFDEMLKLKEQIRADLEKDWNKRFKKD